MMILSLRVLRVFLFKNPVLKRRKAREVVGANRAGAHSTHRNPYSMSAEKCSNLPLPLHKLEL